MLFKTIKIMNENIELDHKVLQKNLELTKALQDVDRLTSDKIDLNAKLDNYAEEIIRLTLKLEELEYQLSKEKFKNNSKTLEGSQ
tara:strand:- start:2162 stop:2416 length:255 start_codon:yes stop_codon:yes gene_type:complete